MRWPRRGASWTMRRSSRTSSPTSTSTTNLSSPPSPHAWNRSPYPNSTPSWSRMSSASPFVARLPSLLPTWLPAAAVGVGLLQTPVVAEAVVDRDVTPREAVATTIEDAAATSNLASFVTYAALKAILPTAVGTAMTPTTTVPLPRRWWRQQPLPPMVWTANGTWTLGLQTTSPENLKS